MHGAAPGANSCRGGFLISTLTKRGSNARAELVLQWVSELIPGGPAQSLFLQYKDPACATWR